MSAPIVHWEIGVKDSAKARAFYGTLFGWEFSDFGQASMVNGTPPGIGGHINCLGHEPHQYVTFYVQVKDLSASLDQAVKLGGSVLIPPQEIPGMGSFAWFKDPEGNVLGMWQPVAGSPSGGG